MSELTEKINDEITKFGDMGEYGVCDGLKVARDVIEEHELQHEIKLNENQQVVLEWLKEKYKADMDIFSVIYYLMSGDMMETELNPAYVALMHLNSKEQTEILQAFSA